ncbi:MAG: polysaccharide deacetylase family protein [Ignavibacteriae bacterium]|nr:polysaccharide deacetylase family protein [Ignavibacteria bacterium]MBI3363536.1 polysaccharide deacetylase family protein [Ignavibacteriota bacterium]
MQLRVGIMGGSAGWSLLLQQEGISFSIVQDGERLQNFSAIIAGDDPTKNELNELRHYLDTGGGVLCSARIFAEMSSIRIHERYIRSLVPEPESNFSTIGFVDVFSACAIPAGANAVLADGEFALRESPFGGGYVVVLPFDAGRLIVDDRQSPKSFYAKTKRLPFERVSLVSKGGVRKLISRALEILHHRRGMPFIHLWYYPEDARSVFSFRIDTDFGNDDAIEELYDLSRTSGIPFTWFLDVESQEPLLPFYEKMEGQEIGVHCYEHRQYDSAEKTISDIERALKALKRSHIEARGFAAPYGQWNGAIHEAIAHYGFEYSSEFSYDYDNLPSMFSIGSAFYTALQVPIHPVSIGTLRRQGFGVDHMGEYFKDIVEQKHSQRDPIILYHHPKDKHVAVLERVFSIVRQLKIPAMRMVDYALWWKERNAISLRIEMEETTCSVKPALLTATQWLHVTRENGTEAFTPMTNAIDLNQLQWMPVPVVPSLPLDIHRIRRFNPWIPLQRTEDFLFKSFVHKL